MIVDVGEINVNFHIFYYRKAFNALLCIYLDYVGTQVVVHRCSSKSEISQESTCVGVFFNKVKIRRPPTSLKRCSNAGVFL